MVKVNPISDYPVSEDAFVLRNLVKRILEITVGAYEDAGVPLPTRRYYCAGQAAEDCEQLVVVFISESLGTPGNQQTDPTPCSGPRFATIEVRVSRPIPQGANGDPARPERLQEASDWPLVDAYILMDTLKQYDVSSFGTPGTGVLANAVAAAPSGFLQTTTLTLTVGIL